MEIPNHLILLWFIPEPFFILAIGWAMEISEQSNQRKSQPPVIVSPTCFLRVQNGKHPTWKAQLLLWTSTYMVFFPIEIRWVFYTLPPFLVLPFRGLNYLTFLTNPLGFSCSWSPHVWYYEFRGHTDPHFPQPFQQWFHLPGLYLPGLSPPQLVVISLSISLAHLLVVDNATSILCPTNIIVCSTQSSINCFNSLHSLLIFGAS